MTIDSNPVSSDMEKQDEFENLVSGISILAIVVITGLIVTMMASSYLIPKHLPVYTARGDKAPVHGTPARMSAETAMEIQRRFDQALALLHGKQFLYAIKALDNVLVLSPNMPEAYVNMGYAYLGLNDYVSAISAFNKATDIRPEQTNAYWGMALAMEGLKEYEGALGAMRAYIHLSTPDDPYLPKARAALWEWEAQLGRIPGVTTKPDNSDNSDNSEKSDKPDKPKKNNPD